MIYCDLKIIYGHLYSHSFRCFNPFYSKYTFASVGLDAEINAAGD
jgi:hypothetical protein